MKLHLIDKELQFQKKQINELQHELNLRKLTPKAFPQHSQESLPPDIHNTITHLQNENTDLKTKLSENEKIIQEFHTIMKDAYTKMEHLYKLNESLHAENTKLQSELTQLKAHHNNNNHQSVKCCIHNDVPYLDDNAHKQCVNKLREKIIDIEKRFNTKYDNTNCIVGSSFRDYTYNSRMMKRTNYFKQNNKDISKISTSTNAPYAFNTNCSSVYNNLNTIEQDEDKHYCDNNKRMKTKGKLTYPHSFTADCYCNSTTHSSNKQQQQSRNSINK